MIATKVKDGQRIILDCGPRVGVAVPIDAAETNTEVARVS